MKLPMILHFQHCHNVMEHGIGYRRVEIRVHSAPALGCLGARACAAREPPWQLDTEHQ